MIQYWVRWQQCVWVPSAECWAWSAVWPTIYACMCVLCVPCVMCMWRTWLMFASARLRLRRLFLCRQFRQATNQATNQPTTHRDNEHNENVVDFFTIPIKSSGFASLFKFSWVHSASRVAAPLLIAFMVLSTLVVVSLSRLCLSRNRSHSYSHNAVALIKWHASI